MRVADVDEQLAGAHIATFLWPPHCHLPHLRAGPHPAILEIAHVHPPAAGRRRDVKAVTRTCAQRACVDRCMRQTAQAIAAHLGLAAIGVPQLKGDFFRRPRWDRAGSKEAVCAEAPVAVTHKLRQTSVELDVTVEVDDHQEVIAQAFVLGERKPVLVPATGRGCSHPPSLPAGPAILRAGFRRSQTSAPLGPAATTCAGGAANERVRRAVASMASSREVRCSMWESSSR